MSESEIRKNLEAGFEFKLEDIIFRLESEDKTVEAWFNQWKTVGKYLYTPTGVEITLEYNGQEIQRTQVPYEAIEFRRGLYQRGE